MKNLLNMIFLTWVACINDVYILHGKYDKKDKQCIDSKVDGTLVTNSTEKYFLLNHLFPRRYMYTELQKKTQLNYIAEFRARMV